MNKELVFIIGKVIISLLVCLLLIYLLLLYLVGFRDNDKLPGSGEKIDYIIILGAKADGSEPSPDLLLRLDKGIEAYWKYQGKIIVSGGQGHDEIATEASVMQKYLITNGIPETDIILEEKAVNTFENIYYAQKLMNSKDHEPKALVITSYYHIFRSRIIADRIGGFKWYGLGCGIYDKKSTIFLLREPLAVIKTFFFDR